MLVGVIQRQTSGELMHTRDHEYISTLSILEVFPFLIPYHFILSIQTRLMNEIKPYVPTPPPGTILSLEVLSRAE